MPLTPQQLAALRAAIDADPALAGQPNNPDGHVAVAAALNLPAAPNYWVWRSSVSRSEIYHQTGVGADGSTASVWDWGVFKAQAVTEQNAWAQMFMGDQAPMSRLNLRDGVFNVFGGGVGTASGKVRVHVFNVGRRLATRGEKLFAAAVASTGGIVVGADNGNTTNQPRGSAANPDVMAFEGAVTPADVEQARSL